MNASPRLLHQVNQSTVAVQSVAPPSHPSVAVLGHERTASGVVLRPDGLILTVQYVVLGARSVSVIDADGRVVPAQVVAQDFHSGIALIRTSEPLAPGLEPCDIGAIAPGADVFVVAVTSDGTRAVNDGIVTSVAAFEANWEFTLDHAIATSARSPGLGGAPVVDARGRVLGITFLDLGEVGRFTLAIPAACYAAHHAELLDNGRRVSRAPRAWAGFFCYTFRSHVVIAGVLPGSPAESSGMRAGDVIVALDDQRVVDQRGLYERLWSQPPGSERAFRVFRGDDTAELMVRTTEAERFFA